MQRRAVSVQQVRCDCRTEIPRAVAESSDGDNERGLHVVFAGSDVTCKATSIIDLPLRISTTSNVYSHRKM